MAYNNGGNRNSGYQNSGYQNPGYRSNGSRMGTSGEKYVGAPYNFIPFTRQTVSYPNEQAPAHNEVSEELYTGEIAYKIEAKTPIIIDNGEGKFWKNNYGEYAIPGSSVRGLIRSNVQVLSLSSIADDVDDYALMYRNVANGAEKENYNAVLGSKVLTIDTGDSAKQVSVLLNVRAGYVKNEKGKYLIYDTGLNQVDNRFGVMNYYILSERKIAKEYQESRGRRAFAYDFFLNGREWITEHDLSRPFAKQEQRGRVQYRGTKNYNYKPYEKACSFELSGRNVTAVGAPGKYSYQGYAVSTGAMNDKKAIYIIPEMDETKTLRFDGEPLPIELSAEDVRAFEIDVNKKANTLRTFGGRDHFDLPKEGQIRPIFYIRLKGRMYFGFTPRLRLFYDHTIKEGMPAEHKAGMLDYAKALFGYSNNERSYKSRISFSDAVQVTEKTEEGLVDIIQAEPKPTSYMDYVVPNGTQGITYNQDGFQLRGMKQYWLRADPIPTGVTEDKKDKPYTSHFTPLPAGTEFEGKVRFHNLKQEELGLLLWALKLNGKSWMNMGKAKSYGYGNIVLTLSDVKVLDPKAAYSLDTFALDPYKAVDPDRMIEAYKTILSGKIGGKNPEEIESIKVFFLMKDPTRMPDAEKIRYMKIDAPEKEYQSRAKALETATEVLGITKPKVTIQPSKTSPSSGSAPTQTTNTRQGQNASGGRPLIKPRTGRNASVSANTAIGGSTPSMKDNAQTAASATTGLIATVRKIYPDGAVGLQQDEVIKQYARIPKENMGGKRCQEGDKIEVKFVQTKIKGSNVSNIYRLVNMSQTHRE